MSTSGHDIHEQEKMEAIETPALFFTSYIPAARIPPAIAATPATIMPGRAPAPPVYVSMGALPDCVGTVDADVGVTATNDKVFKISGVGIV